MKKILLAMLLALLAVSSCQKTETPSPSEDSTVLTVTLGPSCGTVWQKTDVIASNGSISEPATKISSDFRTASFKFDEPLTAPFEVSFPAQVASEVPSSQKYCSDGADPDCRLYAGSGETANITLEDARAYVKVTIAKGGSETISSISIADISGTGFSNITVSGNESIPYSGGKASAVFTVPAGTYAEGFMVSAVTLEGDIMDEAIFPTSYSATAGCTVDLPEITFAKAATVLGGGSGTAADPYLISSLDDFVSFASLVSGPSSIKYGNKSYAQTVSLDFSSVANPAQVCPNPAAPFRGTYDGRGNKIIGFSGAKSFIGYLDGDVENLEFVGLNLKTTGEKSGAVASVMLGGTVKGVSLSGAFSAAAPSSGVVAGSVEGKSVISDICTKVDFVSTSYNVGGIVGQIDTKEDVQIDRSVVYNKITGYYNIGGIVGYSKSSGGAEVAVTNCLCAVEDIEATGNFYDEQDWDSYCYMGGIAGHITNADAESDHQLVNNSSLLRNVLFPAMCNGQYTTRPCAGGIFGKQDGPGAKSSVQGCFSVLPLHGVSRTDINFASVVNNNEADIHPYGSVYGMENGMTYFNCYWMDTTKMGLNPTSNVTECGISGPYAQTVNRLNGFVSIYKGEYALGNWELDSRGYPVVQGFTSDNGSGNMKIRISVIGDSISTFRNWIPIGNAVWYFNGKTESGKVCDVSVDKTYWHEVAYKYLPNARIEKNIAWSGSCTTNCDNQDTKPGFITRFRKWGIGAPDVVIIHGGTNDRGRNTQNIVVDNTAGCAYNAMPTQAMMDKIFATPVNDLEEKYYLDAMTKLCRLIHEAHPNAKVILLTPDRLEEGMYWGIQQICQHYDYIKIADVRQYGYNNLPKFKGSHPTAAGHDTMARQIMTDCGDWIQNK